MKYIDADRLIAEIEGKRDGALERQKNLEKIGQETVLNEMIVTELNRLLSFIDSLQQEPPINTELCTLIACDVIQATAKRAIEKPQDKDKEEDLMVKKMEYLNMLEKSVFLQEQKEFNILSSGSGAMGTTSPKFKLEVKSVEPEVDLEKEVEKYLLDNADFVIKSTSNEMVNTLARHFYELGKNTRKEK